MNRINNNEIISNTLRRIFLVFSFLLKIINKTNTIIPEIIKPITEVMPLEGVSSFGVTRILPFEVYSEEVD
jgi:hypothetical protein